MCGIAGFIDETMQGDADGLQAIAQSMADRLRHRGPDDAGVWIDPAAGLAFGHRRLSIVDLSPGGHQPMISASGRTILSYNGEVYNAAEIRRELEADGHRPAWCGHSDTEVILEACDHWGVEETAKRLIGMFAFSLWDRRMRSLSLVRDRLGIKPMYWGAFDRLFVFGSELKALKCHPRWQPEVDTGALTAFFRYGYVPAPFSIYRGINKLAPGTILTVRPGEPPRIDAFWNLEAVARQGVDQRRNIPDSEAVNRLDALLRDAVGRRMVADVPIGVFLSGGIDSSAVVALMQQQSPTPVRTFTIGFEESEYDEAAHAREVARHIGTQHTELYALARDALDIIPLLPTIYDEPFADSSQIPTYLISRMTRGEVTVALSGDGGDEVFAGYNRHAVARNWKLAKGLPDLARSGVARTILGLSPDAWTRLAGIVPDKHRPPQAGDKLYKLAEALTSSPDAIYRGIVSLWSDPAALVSNGVEPDGPETAGAVRAFPDLLDRLQYLDARAYLPDDILTKVDRASMAVSLEVRVPLIDHRVVEFAWTLPASQKIRRGKTKWLLRQVLERYVPSALVERPKSGFAVPLDSWLRGPLRDWAETLLSEHNLRSSGFLEPSIIRSRWDEFLARRGNWQQPLWAVLMFQSWLQAEKAAVQPFRRAPSTAKA